MDDGFILGPAAMWQFHVAENSKQTTIIVHFPCPHFFFFSFDKKPKWKPWNSSQGLLKNADVGSSRLDAQLLCCPENI